MRLQEYIVAETQEEAQWLGDIAGELGLSWIPVNRGEPTIFFLNGASGQELLGRFKERQAVLGLLSVQQAAP